MLSASILLLVLGCLAVLRLRIHHGRGHAGCTLPSRTHLDQRMVLQAHRIGDVYKRQVDA